MMEKSKPMPNQLPQPTAVHPIHVYEVPRATIIAALI